MEASALKHASRKGLLARRSGLLRLQGDDRLVALIRAGHDRAFEVLFDRYHARLLAFCRHMLASSEDAEDVLQEVFTNAHAAILGDNRHLNVRPWLYRIARNRCLNHLRRPVPEGQDSMDVHPHEGGTTTAERVQKREDFRALVADVQDLPETQRTALLLREIEALSYDEIASAMDTTVPAVKSLLVRARMSLAEATRSRLLSCGEVQLELAEVAEGLTKLSAPARHHVRRCDACGEYRAKLRSNRRQLAGLAPPALLVWLHTVLGTKLLGLGSGAGGGSAAGSAAAGSTAAAGSGAAAGATAAGGAAGAGGALTGAAAAAGGAAGGLSGALGTKAVAGIATAALITAGAVEVRHLSKKDPQGSTTPAALQGSPGPDGAAPLGAAAVGGLRESDDEPEGSNQGAGAGVPGDPEQQRSATAATSSDPAPSPDPEPGRDRVDGAVGSATEGSGRRGGRAKGSGVPGKDPATKPSVPCPQEPTDPKQPPKEDPPSGDEPGDPPGGERAGDGADAPGDGADGPG